MLRIVLGGRFPLLLRPAVTGTRIAAALHGTVGDPYIQAGRAPTCVASATRFERAKSSCLPVIVVLSFLSSVPG